MDIEFDQITTFIGPNGAGKSTVLRALDWFFNGTKTSELSDDDFTHGSKSRQIVVEVEFCSLTDEDRAELGAYVTPGSDRFIAWKYREEDGSEKMTSNARTFEAFDAMRQPGVTATERKKAYDELRRVSQELGLPLAATDVARKDAMRTWELEHPDRLTESQQVVTNFFGFNSQAKMSGLFDYVLVTADLRASEQILDSKATIIGRILERTISREAADAEIELLAAEIQKKQKAVYDSHFTTQLDTVSTELSRTVAQYTVGRTLRLSTDDFELKPPRTQFKVSVLDNAVETNIARQGHGFQRALLIAALQVLATHGAAAQGNGSLCLAIEEPELFQHPVQAQAFAQVLRKLAENTSQKVQVTYATHSPYFLSAEHFQEIRRVTRKSSGVSPSPAVTVTMATVEGVLAKLDGYVDPDVVGRQFYPVFLTRLPEALFANAVVVTEGTTDCA